ncbi:MAG TPA: GNAT family N-acetyltransferase [Acidimicrobiales bacterium]
MSAQPVTIRAIDDADWPSVYAIFRDIVAEGETYAYTDTLSPDLAKALWIAGPPGETVVALVDDVIRATATFGPNRPGRGAHVSTASFMVASDARGQGIGRALCEFAISRMKERGFAGMQFNAVVSTNSNAIALYRTLGFVTIGTVPGAFDSASQGRVGLDVMYLEF